MLSFLAHGVFQAGLVAAAMTLQPAEPEHQPATYAAPAQALPNEQGPCDNRTPNSHWACQLIPVPIAEPRVTLVTAIPVPSIEVPVILMPAIPTPTVVVR